MKVLLLIFLHLKTGQNPIFILIFDYLKFWRCGADSEYASRYSDIAGTF